jgi:hypothetical protein
MSRPPPAAAPRRDLGSLCSSLLQRSLASGGKEAGYLGGFFRMLMYISFLFGDTNGVHPVCISYIKMPRHHQSTANEWPTS